MGLVPYLYPSAACANLALAKTLEHLKKYLFRFLCIWNQKFSDKLSEIF